RDRDRYFREVDRAITEHHSRPSGLPLILAALPEQQSHFRRLSHNDCLLPEGIETGQNALSVNELREKSWMVMQPRYLKRLEGLLNQFGASHG
ncbi:baeRF3 domain-containing protein, partial [Klebsiella pneumoniae]